MALRRRGEEVTKIDMHTNILPDKKLRKNIQSCFRALNHIDDKDTFSYIGDEEFDSLKVFKILKEARELTVSLLQSVFNFSSMPRPKTKVSRWSLTSNALHKRKVACKDDSEDVEANDGVMAASQPFHVRSISLPSRDHPSMLKTEEELKKFRSFLAQSSLTSHTIVDGLKGLGGLYECIDEVLHLPSSNQHFSSQQQKEWMEVELDGSIRLLELLGTLKDCTQEIKCQIRDQEMALRRQGEAVAKHEIHTHILSDKKLRKNIQNYFRSLKHMNGKDALSCTEDKEYDSGKVIKSLKEARVLAIHLLQSVSDFLSMPRPKRNASRWPLISKTLHKRKVTCKGEHEDAETNDECVPKIKDQLQTFQNSINHLEEGLDFLYRRLIRNRVAVLNFFSLFSIFQHHLVIMAASQPSHVRSISLPSKDHPSRLKTEKELRKLKSFIAQSSLTSHMILDGLKVLGSLYECINELLHLPSSNQHCSDNQQKKWMEAVRLACRPER
ncbi:hypothetical protein ZIOFF_015847 [Zingiber officinale]|uniref:Uncharacterized protein n=2 Tax=Zingiber officinale TaxID=94328 RepID=A0A8J5HDI7_ZINOF|nr:hypothetical protein ZIOFF_015847 [Zingiber officinale]